MPELIAEQDFLWTCVERNEWGGVSVGEACRDRYAVGEVLVQKPRQSLHETDAARLASLMDLDPAVDRAWSPDELGAVLRHQLAAPLLVDLSSLRRNTVAKVKTLAEAQGLVLKSFGDLLRHPHPPVELLEITHRFAKACTLGRTGPLPRDIATMLYYAAIVAAMSRCGRRISRLADSEIRLGIQWALSRPWIEESLRGLFEEGCRLMEQDGITGQGHEEGERQR